MHFFTKPRLISWFLLSMIAGALFFSSMSGPRQERTLLYFQRYNGELGVEERYIPTLPGQDIAVTLVHELLLGPADRDFLHLTDPEVQPRSCFVRGNALYVDLPLHALTPQTKTPDFYTVYTLLQKNITTNCKNITGIYLYIDGTPAYAKHPGA